MDNPVNASLHSLMEFVELRHAGEMELIVQCNNLKALYDANEFEVAEHERYRELYAISLSEMRDLSQEKVVEKTLAKRKKDKAVRSAKARKNIEKKLARNATKSEVPRVKEL
jgi:hypothetical protein